MFVLISAQYILWLLSETEGIVYLKLLMRAEQEKKGTQRGQGARGREDEHGPWLFLTAISIGDVVLLRVL